MNQNINREKKKQLLFYEAHFSGEILRQNYQQLLL